MAEGGDLQRSINYGSDTVLELICSPCKDDGTREVAAHFCPECKQYLCVTCTKYHKRFPATKYHLLHMANASGRIQQAAPNIAKCHFHPERDIEMYCGTHDMVYCTLCIAKDHRSCIYVSETDDVAITKLDSTVNYLSADTDNACKKIDEAKLKKQNHLKRMTEMKTELLKEIRQVRKKLSKHLDDLEKKAVTEIGLKYTDLENEVQAEVTALHVLSCSLQKSKLNLNKYGQTNGKQQFVLEKLGERVVLDAEALLKTAHLGEVKTISFTRNKELCDFVTTVASMGTVQRDSQANIQKPRALTVRSRREIHVSEAQTNVCAICQLPDGTIVLAEEASSKVMRLDDDYNVRDYCKLSSEIVGMCCTGENEVAVKLKSNSLRYVSVGTELTAKKTVDMECSSVNYGLAFWSGKLWVSDGNGINIFDVSGSLKKRIEYDRNRAQIFKDNTNNLTVDNDAATVYVADFGNRVVAFGRDGCMIKVLSDHRLQKVRGVCLSSHGIILASCFIFGTIVMFSTDGSCLGVLVSGTDSLKYSQSLCYDKKMDRLLVGGAKSNITVFELGE